MEVECTDCTKNLPAKRKRNCDPLAMNSYDLKYAKISKVNGDCYLVGKRARGDSKELHVNNHKRAVIAGKASAAARKKNKVSARKIPSSAKMNADMSTSRRYAISFIFQYLFHSPPESEWCQLKTVNEVMDKLEINPNSRTSVMKIMRDILVCNDTNTIYNPLGYLHSAGAKKIIKDLDDSAQVIYLALGSGLSLQSATVMVNLFRVSAKQNKPPISWGTVRNFAKNSDIIKRHRRQTTKSGKKDPETVWSKARKQQCIQMLEQFRLGKLDANHGDVVNSPYGAMQLHGIVFWDEKHKQCIQGFSSKIETSICKDKNGNPASPTKGGEFSQWKPKTAVKYPKEARGLFGVAMRKQSDGSMEGVKCKPFNYSNRKVVSYKDYKKEMQDELVRVLTLKRKWEGGGGYEARYGANWEQELKKKVDIKYCCINDLIDHVILESERIYKNTEVFVTFKIYHDGLVLWWSKEAQAYITSKNYSHRQIKCIGDTNSDNRYKNKVVGDSPEMCRGLDSHGFADLESSITYHASLTSIYEFDNPERFNTGTPTEMWHTMERCWAVEPTSARIVEDISAFLNVLDIIKKANGCVVSDLSLRSGRRYFKF